MIRRNLLPIGIGRIKPRILPFLAAVFLALPSPGHAQGSTAAADTALVKALQDMGYMDIQANGCALMFSRDIDPSQANNALRKYTRFVHLDTLDFTQTLAVEHIVLRDSSFYILKIPFTKVYLDGAYWEFQRASLKIRSALDLPDWPLPGPGFYTDKVVAGERLLRQYLRDLSVYNRWVYYTKFGETMGITPNFNITYFTQQPLEAFMKGLSRYSYAQNCVGKAVPILIGDRHDSL